MFTNFAPLGAALGAVAPLLLFFTPLPTVVSFNCYVELNTDAMIGLIDYKFSDADPYEGYSFYSTTIHYWISINRLV